MLDSAGEFMDEETEPEAAGCMFAQGLAPEGEEDKNGIPIRFPEETRRTILGDFHYGEVFRAIGVVVRILIDALAERIRGHP